MIKKVISLIIFTVLTILIAVNYEDIIKNQSEKNIFSKFISIASKKNTNYNLYIEIDEKKFNDLKDEIAQDVNIECIEPKVIINDEKISYKK